ncbi:hypothetical protein [Aeromicrobium sp. 9AM]|uniref:hypothetical protein n=1 Tax=Aeromicrobium sp. 9AM TaxID=2653126 RepID=UPI0012F36C8E|nr:hypothetical protein [Aeromicrobium sp. 9AM]VXB51581.1 conserved hypothetical protein [Aeromicrobium sp. 9AM]
MNDEQKTPEAQPDDTAPTVQQDTAEAPPAAAPTTNGSSRTRNTLIAGGAGLVLVGGLVGFGIGHATADGDGDQFRRIGHYAPGDGRPGFGEGGRPGGHGDFGPRDQGGDQRPRGERDPA